MIIGAYFYLNYSKSNLKSKCCEQCSYAAGHDPRAFDTSNELCSSSYYKNEKIIDKETGQATDENVITEECIAYFENNPLTVSDCRLNYKSDLTWKKGENSWTLTDNKCLKETEMTYSCYSNCFEKSKEDIWNLCENKAGEDIIKVRTTDTGIEVLCFSNGCEPHVSNGECQITCPN